MAAYLEQSHHPQHALEPRIIFVCLDGDLIIGYVGGHLTRRFGCDAELQYLYVVPEYRRRGIACELLAMMSGWFVQQEASAVCVDVEPDNSAARAFYAHHGAVPLSEYWMIWNDAAAIPGRS